LCYVPEQQWKQWVDDGTINISKQILTNLVGFTVKIKGGSILHWEITDAEYTNTPGTSVFDYQFSAPWEIFRQF
jgi:hypothetical protein